MPSDARKQTMAQIEVVGRQMMAENGVDQLRMGELADRARVSRATLYRYYEDKHAFIRSALIGILRATLTRAGEYSTDDHTRLRELFENLDEFLSYSPAFNAVRRTSSTSTLYATGLHESIRNAAVSCVLEHVDPAICGPKADVAVTLALQFWATDSRPYSNAGTRRIWAHEILALPAPLSIAELAEATDRHPAIAGGIH